MIFCKSQYPSLNVHFLRGQSRNSLRQIVADLRFCSAGTRGVVALSLFSTYQHASIYQLIPVERSKLKAKLKPKPWQSALTLLCVWRMSRLSRNRSLQIQLTWTAGYRNRWKLGRAIGGNRFSSRKSVTERVRVRIPKRISFRKTSKGWGVIFKWTFVQIAYLVQIAY